jgi:hypothetical protein
MVVRPDDRKWVVQKVMDEGTQSPFVARLLVGILSLRDTVFPADVARHTFDKSYEIATRSVFSARENATGFTETWSTHLGKVAAGEIARVKGRSIQVDENIDKELRRHMEGFLNAATRALKQGMQAVAKDLQVDIGFLFQKQGSFEAGLSVLKEADSALAEYLRHTREWSQRLLERRNALEHEGWTLAPVTYVQKAGYVEAIEPLIEGQSASQFVATMFDRVVCFVEEVTAHCLQRQMPSGITVSEIAVGDREPDVAERFRLTLAKGGMPAWKIVFDEKPFEDR